MQALMSYGQVFESAVRVYQVNLLFLQYQLQKFVMHIFAIRTTQCSR